MKHLLMLALALWMTGCASATRLSMPPEETRTRFQISHAREQGPAFQQVEVALAESYNDLPAVLKLRQPESGTLLLKPLVAYRVGGALGVEQHALYSLKVVVAKGSVSLEFELGPEVSAGTWAPASEVPKIKATFRTIAEHMAKAVDGSLEVL